jgi:hypothetical protein
MIIALTLKILSNQPVVLINFPFMEIIGWYKSGDLSCFLFYFCGIGINYRFFILLWYTVIPLNVEHFQCSDNLGNLFLL